MVSAGDVTQATGQPLVDVGGTVRGAFARVAFKDVMVRAALDRLVHVTGFDEASFAVASTIPGAPGGAWFTISVDGELFEVATDAPKDPRPEKLIFHLRLVADRNMRTAFAMRTQLQWADDGERGDHNCALLHQAVTGLRETGRR